MYKNTSELLVSIIIPTYNSASTLEITLSSIQKQTYKNIEIIVVDNNSRDSTKEIAFKYTNAVYNKWPERTAQKNFWLEKSQWKYVFFVDSDMELTREVVWECVELFENGGAIWWICIPERSVWEWFFVQIRDFERSFYDGSSVESARFFSLEDVKTVWGFEEDLIFFEESLLPQKIESRLQKSCKHRINNYIHHHEWEINFWKWLSKKFYYGKSLDKYKQKVQEIWIKETGNNQMGIINRYMIFLKNKRFYTRPVLALWVFWLKTLEFGAGALWLAYSKINK